MSPCPCCQQHQRLLAIPIVFTSSRIGTPTGQNSSLRMKFNSQTTPLTTFSLLLTTCHVVQTHTFHSVAPMGVLTNLQIGTEHNRADWEQLKISSIVHHEDKYCIKVSKN